MRVRARHHATGEPIEVLCRGGVIAYVGPPTALPADQEAQWLAPALFDLQINGCEGHSFNSPSLTVDSIRQVVAVCQSHGIGGLCPTLVTGSFEALAHGFRTLRQACESDPDLARALPGFHLEGPYISPEDGPRGAHPLQHVRPPNWDEWRRWQDAAGGRIRLVTLSPEHEGALAFIERLAVSDVVVAIGHTAASGMRIREAIRAGARLSTHLGNGSHALLPRHENYLWEQLAADELWASVIADGHHLPLALLKCILRVKTPARLIVTCDASSLAGLAPGRYGEWGQEFEVRPEGKIVVPGTSFLAGSAVFTDACVNHLVTQLGVSRTDALEMASARPRDLLGLPRLLVRAGYPADLVLFEERPGTPFLPRALLRAGQLVWART